MSECNLARLLVILITVQVTKGRERHKSKIAKVLQTMQYFFHSTRKTQRRDPFGPKG